MSEAKMTQTNSNRGAADVSGVLPAGAKLGKYKIVERLGSGGQSIVYKGYDEMLDRHVAIKQVAPQLAADEKFTKRFRDVVQQLAKLGCEQIVTIYELMEEGGGLFVVMEFVEGHTIETTLADQTGPVDVKAVLQIIWRIGAGLAAIHKAGIVHRDIKPGNIIVAEGLRIKIADFGVAARAGSAVSMRLGTTKYMAPELFAGAEADGRADIYSLGMIAYEMLLGRAKFNEIFHDVVRDPHSEALRWMKWHSSTEQVATPLVEVNPEIPKALSATVARMMAKDPDERFSNVEELGMEIRANFSPRAQRPSRRKRRRGKPAAAVAEREGPAAAPGGEEPALAPQAGVSEPVTAEIPKEPMSLRKKLTLAGVAVGVIVLTLLAYGIVEGTRQRKIRRQVEGEYFQAMTLYKKAAKARTSAGKKSDFAAALKAFEDIADNKQYQRQAAARQAQVRASLCQAHLGVLDDDDAAADRHIVVVETTIIELQRDRGELYKWTKRIEQEVSTFRDYWNNHRLYLSALKRARDAMAVGELDRADKILLNTGDLTLSDEQISAILALRRDIAEKQKQSEYWSHIRRGDELAAGGNIAGAIAAWDKAVAVLESARQTLSPKIYEDLKKTAEDKRKALRDKTDYDAAIAQARKAEEAGDLLTAADHYEKANKIKPDKALPARARDLRHDHYLNLGRQHLTANRLRQAEEAFKKAQSHKASTAVETELAKLQGVKNFRLLLGQGNRLFRQKKYEAAREKYEAALKLSGELKLPTGAEVKSKITDCRFFLEMAAAQAHQAESEWAKAEAAYNRARQIKPAASDEIDARLVLLRQERDYTEYVAAAKKALGKGDFNEALRQARGAKNIRATTEADQLIQRIRYEQQKALGDDAMERGDYNSASAYFKAAKRYMSTPEIDQLIQQAEKLKREASGGS